MKKLFCILMMVIIAFSLCACFDSEQDANSNSSEDSTNNSQTSDSSSTINSNIMQGAGALGDYYVKIVSAEVSEDYFGNDVLIVTYNWTNNSKEAESFMLAFTAKAYQNGIECEEAYMVDDVDTSDQTKDIKPGVSMTVKIAYELNDSSKITIEVTEWLSYSNKKVTKTFSI